MSDQNCPEPGCTLSGDPARHVHLVPSGLPQSQLGGLHPELRARITSARAATDAFERETNAYIDGSGDRPLFEDHAWRLHTELKLLLSKIEDVK